MTPRISAVLLTRAERRANVPRITERVLACPAVGEVLIARDHPERVWGRYALARRASLPLVYFQDDDCLVDVGELLALYDEIPGLPICRIARTHAAFVAGQAYNTRSGIARLGMVGWGALFPRAALDAVWSRMVRALDTGDGVGDAMEFSALDLPLVRREADRIVTLLCPALRLVEADVAHLPGASGPEALSLEPGHAEWRARAIERALAIRNGEAAR